MLRSITTSRLLRDDRLISWCSLTYKRYLPSDHGPKDTGGPKTTKPIAKKVEKMKKYWFFRFVDYIENYDQTLEKTFPRMMHVYRLVSSGTKELYVDLKKYIALKKKQTLHGSDVLSREELQLSHTMPRDVAKITPFLVVLAIPFTNYILFPIAYFFPRKVLTSHYWTQDQKAEFMAIDHKMRQKDIAKVLMSLEQEEKRVQDSTVIEHWNDLIRTIRNRHDPSVEQVLACKPLFVDGPFTLEKIKRPHVKELLLTHGMSTWTFYKREALLERGILLQRMDVAIMKEGGPTKMVPNALAVALSFRGIDPTDMSTQGMESWLDKWLQISSQVDNKSISLLLHCPILLAYNWNTC